MTHFSYTYRTTEGQLSDGSLSAADRRQALVMLKKKGVIAIKLVAETEANTDVQKIGSSKKVDPFESTQF